MQKNYERQYPSEWSEEAVLSFKENRNLDNFFWDYSYFFKFNNSYHKFPTTLSDVDEIKAFTGHYPFNCSKQGSSFPEDSWDVHFLIARYNWFKDIRDFPFRESGIGAPQTVVSFLKQITDDFKGLKEYDICVFNAKEGGVIKYLRKLNVPCMFTEPESEFYEYCKEYRNTTEYLRETIYSLVANYTRKNNNISSLTGKFSNIKFGIIMFPTDEELSQMKHLIKRGSYLIVLNHLTKTPTWHYDNGNSFWSIEANVLADAMESTVHKNKEHEITLLKRMYK